MKNITVVTVVFNEEKRIETFIKSFLWSNDLIIIDKSSTDSTREIIRHYPSITLIDAPYSDTGSEFKLGIDIAKNEWLMTLTASDIIHPDLVEKLLKLINDPSFDYEAVALPFAMMVFGIREVKRSPWGAATKELLYRKNVIKTSSVVHEEFSHVSRKIYKFKYSEYENLFHLTHETLETFFERHIRYTRLESNKYSDCSIALKSSLKELIRSVKCVTLKRKTFLLGWDGIALSLAYVSYFIFKFLFVWEKFRGKGRSEYSTIRSDILSLWERRDKKENLYD
ncbi:MAG: glycosyltransferase [Chitinispirillaceae bacterium]|nr:glycosyltransferase [Chitinispirillaceae bacterium]